LVVGSLVRWLFSPSIVRTAGTRFIVVAASISKVLLCSKDAREDDALFPTNEQHEHFITLKGTGTRMQAPLCKSNHRTTTSYYNMQ
jgi:hypothetical protein